MKIDQKTAKKELVTALAKARSTPLNFAFLISKDGPLLLTDPRKTPAVLWAAARKSGGGGKGAMGVMSFDSGKLLLRCEEEPAAIVSKSFKSYLLDHGQTQKFAFEGPAASKDSPIPAQEPARPKEPRDISPEPEHQQVAQGHKPADPEPDGPVAEPEAIASEVLEEEEPVSGVDLGELIRKARKKPMNAAWLIAKGDMVLRAHHRLPVDLLRRQAKADGGGPKGAWGVITVSGKVISVTCADPPPRAFSKAARRWLAGQGFIMKVIVTLPDGSTEESDPAEDAAVAPPKTAQAQTALEVKALTQELLAKKDVLTKKEEATFARALSAIVVLVRNGELKKAQTGLARVKIMLDQKLTPEARLEKMRAELAAAQGQISEELTGKLQVLLDRAAKAEPDIALKILTAVDQKLDATSPAPKSSAPAASQGAPVAFSPPEPLPDPVAPMVEGLSAERKGEMKKWLETYGEYDNYWQGGDDEGGEYLSAALLGEDTALGVLNEQEMLQLSLMAAELWRKKGTSEHIQEAAEGVRDDARASRALALAFAARSGNDQRFFDTGGSYYSDPDNSAAQSDMMMRALDLDAGAVLEAFQGAEVSLALRASGFLPEAAKKTLDEDLHPLPFDLKKRTGLVEALAKGVLGEEETDLVGTTFFMAATAEDLEDPEYRAAMARLLGTVAGGDKAAEASARLEKVMAVSGAREMLFAKSVPPEMRNWALAQIANNPDFDAAALAQGWESEIVAQAMAGPVIQKYAGRGGEPHELPTSGEAGALRNSIGQTLGLPFSALGEETAEQAEARLDAGMSHDYYKNNKRIDKIAALIAQEGGDPAKMTVIPVVVTNPELGVINVNVFRLDQGKAPDGTPKSARFVDDFGFRYDDFEHWRSDNQLPPGKMTYPARKVSGQAVDMDLAGEMVTENTPVKVDTILEWIGVVGDVAAMIVGVGVGVAAIVGSGGLATPLVVAGGGAALWQVGRAGDRLYDDSQRGVDITDVTNAENRSNWLEVGAGALSIGALGAAARTANMAAKSMQITQGTARVTTGLQMASSTVDAVAMGDQAHMMADNWDQMTETQKAMGLLNIGFWGGMGLAGRKAGGGLSTDDTSFTRLANQAEFGTPYVVTTHPDLSPGQIRVAYDAANVGDAPTNIRIETGGGEIDKDLLDLHANVGRQIENSGGLSQKLKSMLADQPDPPIGSKGWEAKAEIDKIAAETELLRLRSEQGDLSQRELDAIAFRQRELEDATEYHFLQLKNFDGQGVGWISAPSQGSEQAAKLGWPVGDDLPEGHHWFATQEQVPVLRRADTSITRMRYDPNHPPEGPKFVPDDRPVVDIDAMILDAQARYGDQSVIPDTELTSTDAFRSIQALRGSRKITDSRGGDGTVSITTVKIGEREEVVIGVNSSNFSDADHALVKHWEERMEVPKGKKGTFERQAMYHAEAHTLMQIYTKTGGNMPPVLTIYVDRVACSSCQAVLPDLVKNMGIDTLKIVLPDRRQAVVTKDGFFGDWQ